MEVTQTSERVSRLKLGETSVEATERLVVFTVKAFFFLPSG